MRTGDLLTWCGAGKLNAGPLELGPARESVYVHRMKDHAIVSLDLLEETLTDKHRSHAYTVSTRGRPLSELLLPSRWPALIIPSPSLVWGDARQVYKVKVMWTDCVWTIQRRYSQFREFNKVIPLSTTMPVP